MPTFGERLKSLRTSKKLTQRNLAEVLGITDRTYQYYEVDRTNPPFPTLIAIANYFQVSLDYLAGRSDVAEMNPASCIRLDAGLKKELEELAKDEMRTLENQVEFFLRKGLQSYKS